MRDMILELIEKHGNFNGNVMGCDTYIVWDEELTNALVKLYKESVGNIFKALKNKQVRTLELDDFVYMSDIKELAEQLGVEVEQ